MMRQSEFKMRFDPELGRFTRKHVYGEGIADVFKSFGSKLFGKTMKKATKKGVEKAVKTAATKTGEHVGNKIVQKLSKEKAGDKIVQMLSNGRVAPPRNPPAKKVIFNNDFETIPNEKMTRKEINQRVNATLSGGSTRKRKII